MELTDTLAAVLDRKGHTVWFVGPDTSVFEAVRWMSEKNVGVLLVIEGGAILGMISERDVMRRGMLHERSPHTTAVRELMTKEVIVADPHVTIEDAMSLMTRHRIRHLPVIDDEMLVGVISIGDLVEWTITEQKRLLDQLESYVIARYPT